MGASVCHPEGVDPGELVQPFPNIEAVAAIPPVNLPLPLSEKASPRPATDRRAEFCGQSSDWQPAHFVTCAPSPCSTVANKSEEASILTHSSAAQKPVELSNLAMDLSALTSERGAVPGPLPTHASSRSSPTSYRSSHSRYDTPASAASPPASPRFRMPGGASGPVTKIIVAEGEWEVHVARTVEKSPAKHQAEAASSPPNRGGMMSRAIGARIQSPGSAAFQQPGSAASHRPTGGSGQQHPTNISQSIAAPPSSSKGKRQPSRTLNFGMQKPADCGSDADEDSIGSGPG